MSGEPEVRPERTGWRDEELSARHRRWGWNCPAIDLDCLFLEYDKGLASALVEYKHERAQPQYASHPSFQALINLGDRAGLPVLACRYAGDFSWWRAVPLNGFAQVYLPERREMTEIEWVSLLYKIRGNEPPANLEHDLTVFI
tara:strand:+ start:974 stop:1402 length:429 start_codon:yes stop_codon:yes gene_type:complete